MKSQYHKKIGTAKNMQNMGINMNMYQRSFLSTCMMGCFLTTFFGTNKPLGQGKIGNEELNEVKFNWLWRRMWFENLLRLRT